MEKEADGMERLFSFDLRIESPVPFPFRCKAKSFGKFEAEKLRMECVSIKLLERTIDKLVIMFQGGVCCKVPKKLGDKPLGK